MTEQASATHRTAVVLATRNRGKILELAGLMRPFGLQVLGLDDFPEVPEIEETGTSFAQNALLKARTVSQITGFVAIADDSGLEVEALGNAPGVWSARYSEAPGAPATDESNIRKLLAEMTGVPQEKRGAAFHCCIAACAPSGEQRVAEGRWEGRITLQPVGTGGFGYDPVFFDPETQRSAAEMSREEKNSRSHRAGAVAALLTEWPLFWQECLRGL